MQSRQEVFVLKKILALTIAMMLTCGNICTLAAEPFSDVPDSDWAAPYIYNLTDRGIVGGYGDGTFMPRSNVRRCEYAKMLVNISGTKLVSGVVSPYYDVSPNMWFFPYINSASEFMTGYQASNGSLYFDPEAPAVREDVAVAIVKALGIDVSQYDNPTEYLSSRFSDWASISQHNRAYIVAAVDMGVITGDENGTFRPKAPIIRAEIVAVLYRAFPDGNNVRANDLQS